VRRLTVDERDALARDKSGLRRAGMTSYMADALSMLEKRIYSALRLDEGQTVSDIARSDGISERTIRLWIAPINKTKPHTVGVADSDALTYPGRPTVYDAEHIARIVHVLPTVADLSRDHWTLNSVQAYLATHHDIAIKHTRLTEILAERSIRLDAFMGGTADDGDRTQPR